MTCRPTMPAPTSCWSTPAASSTAPRRKASKRSARRSPRTAASSSPAAWARKPTSSAPASRKCSRSPGRSNMRKSSRAVHEAAPPVPIAVSSTWCPKPGLKLTPRHYSYLKISEGCNHRCAFCIIPSIRGDLVSRRPDAILREAEKLVAAGTKELLVISQDTSAYGVDIRHAAAAVEGRRGPRPHDRPRPRAGQARHAQATPGSASTTSTPTRTSTSVIPLMAEGLVLPYLDIPFQHASPKVLQAMKRPANEAKVLERIAELARDRAPTSPSARASSSASPARPRRISSISSTGSRKRSSTASARSASSRSRAPPPTPCPTRCPKRSRKSATRASWS